MFRLWRIGYWHNSLIRTPPEKDKLKISFFFAEKVAIVARSLS